MEQAMKHTLEVASIMILGLCPGCGPGDGSELEAQRSNCLASSSLGQSDGAVEAKTLAELVGGCDQNVLSLNSTKTETH